MKHITKFKIILPLLFFILIFFIGSVSGTDELIIIEGFDTYTESVSLGSNAFVSWSGHSSYKTSATLKISTPMSLKCDLSSISSLQDCYINITDPVIATGGEFWLRYSANDQEAYSIVNFINESDNVFLKFRIYHKFLSDIDIYDNDSWFTFGQTGSNNNFWGYGWQGNHTGGNPDNYVYYYIKNDTGSIIDSVEKRWISSDGFFGEPLHTILIQTYDNAGGSVNVYYEDLSGIGDYSFTVDTIPKLRNNPALNSIEKAIIGVMGIIILIGFLFVVLKMDFKKEGALAKLLVGILLALALLTLIFNAL